MYVLELTPDHSFMQTDGTWTTVMSSNTKFFNRMEDLLLFIRTSPLLPLVDSKWGLRVHRVKLVTTPRYESIEILT